MRVVPTALNLAERKDAILLVLICTGRDQIPGWYRFVGDQNVLY